MAAAMPFWGDGILTAAALRAERRISHGQRIDVDA